MVYSILPIVSDGQLLLTDIFWLLVKIFLVQELLSFGYMMYSSSHVHHGIVMVGIPADQNSQNGGPQAISEILQIEYRIVCCIETYLIHIYHMSKCSKSNWNRYIEGFCMWNVHFHINGLSPNIVYVILMSWPLMAIYFLLLNYWLFSVQFSYHI